MKNIGLSICAILGLVGCTTQTVIKPTTCPTISLPEYVSYDINETVRLSYYVDSDNIVHGLSGTTLNNFINLSYRYQGYLYGAKQELILYRHKIQTFNELCGSK